MQKLLLLTYILLVPTLTLADIAFLSDRDGKPDIYVMNDEGGNVRRVTDAPFSIGNPTWSPDGRQIGFAMDLHSGEPGNPQGLRQQYDTFIINADGTRQQNLTEHPALDSGPSWAPDGKYFAFDSGRAVDGTLEIFVMEIATRKVWQLTHLGFVASPDWSPDGKKIVYEYVKPGEGRHIYTMDADGGNPRPLLRQPRRGQFGNTGIISGFPSWSPDGEYILYTELEVGAKGRVANSILIVHKDTRHLKVLDTPKRWKLGKTCWADGGNAVLFAAVPNGLGQPNKLDIFKIYRYDLSDRQIINLTDHPSDNWGMDWTPHNSLAVSSAAKMTTHWARIKAAARAAFSPGT